ncbi:uncharacterized protein N7469_009945 [Penicillium citrinum]|uniref:Uncharacterized protein n=1 Tax=Penicillium citrinum TaxID=5077 RepID=A0A9W9TFR8_PENCI|nr:uncharacterized protein N7469_009945 [Penicillium citrinum]KAJ5221058.1 hypothetical protein N7469_009945 [Penicillium citrinum]
MGTPMRLIQRSHGQWNRSKRNKWSRNVTTVANPHKLFLDPSPLELLQATLLGSVTSKTKCQTDADRNRQILDLIEPQWQGGYLPPPLWHALKGVSSTGFKEAEGRLKSITTISSLKDVTERLVIDVDGARSLQSQLPGIISRCRGQHSSAELLSVFGDIIVRLQRLKLPINSDTYGLGMELAAENLSSVAFHRFFTGFIRSPKGIQISHLHNVIQILYETVRQELFESPHYDTTHILAEITGEYDAFSENGNIRLHDFLYSKLGGSQDDFHADLATWTNYLCLLSILQSREPLISSWKAFMKSFRSETSSNLHSMYSVVLALSRVGRSETAAKFLEDISIRNGDSLPSLTEFPHVREILNDSVLCQVLVDIVGNHEYEALLELAVGDIERRLGLQWVTAQQSEIGAHSSITPGSLWTSFEHQPLFTIDGDCAGYDNPSRLFSELEVSGCSRSPDQLGQIAELLHEHDGSGFEVTSHNHSTGGIPRFKWCPQHSPIEFSHSQLPVSSDRTGKWTPTSLGLIWARPLINGIVQERGKSFHFMQLGSLDMQYNPNERWQPSGYIVVWDRQFGHMNALFVGTDHGVIDRGPMPSNAPFGTILRIRLPHIPDSEHWSSADHFHLDLDPSLDLYSR